MTDPTTSTIEGQLITTEEYVELTESGEETEEEQIQPAAEEEKPAPVEVKPLPVLLIEDILMIANPARSLFRLASCQVMANPKGRNVVITAHSHNDAPIITMKRAGDIEDYGTEIQTMMTRYSMASKRTKPSMKPASRSARRKKRKPPNALPR